MKKRVWLSAALLVGVASACSSTSDSDNTTPTADVDAGTDPIDQARDAGDDPIKDPGSSNSDDASTSDSDSGTSDSGYDASTPPPPPPPADLVKCMDAKPYVEESCTKTTVKGWPHEAKECTYSSPIGPLKVTVADASAERVAIWIVDAADSVPAIAQIKTSDPPRYLRTLQGIAAALMLQSSRIFPIAGKVGEDMGDGYYAYPFSKGVSTPCPKTAPGCYCRINSLLPGEYCDYRVGVGIEDLNTCKKRLGYGSGSNDSWLNQCLANHAAAWDNVTNEHIRAKTWIIARDFGLSTSSTGPQVVKAFDKAYGLNDNMVGQFCK